MTKCYRHEFPSCRQNFCNDSTGKLQMISCRTHEVSIDILKRSCFAGTINSEILALLETQSWRLKELINVLWIHDRKLITFHIGVFL